MSDEELRTCIDLCFYRFEKAAEDLKTAKNNFGSQDYRAANNRSYYSIFHSLRAVLALDHYDSKKHSGIIAEFRRKYIKNRIFPVEMSGMIDSAFEIRNASDYNDMFIADKNETKKQIENAEYVLKVIEEYIGLPISAYKELFEKEGEVKESQMKEALREKSFGAFAIGGDAMPMKPKRPCSCPGCPNLTDGRFCPEHQQRVNSNYEKYGRDKATKKRYGRAWKRIRDKYAAEHPFCELCFDRGIIVPTEEIHHKRPLSEGGTHDRDNLIALCKSCHSLIHAHRGDYWGNRRG